MEKETDVGDSSEKYNHDATPAPPYDDDAGRVTKTKGVSIGEATGMYGDVATAEDYGYVTRGFDNHEFAILMGFETDSV